MKFNTKIHIVKESVTLAKKRLLKLKLTEFNNNGVF